MIRSARQSSNEGLGCDHSRRRALGFALWQAAACAAGLSGSPGCGYTVGRGFQAEIRSVYVPIFTSKSFRRNVEFQLTEAVQKQIQNNTHFRLTTEEDADTRLIGKILDVRKGVLGKNQFNDARELSLEFIVDVKWEDLRNNKIIAQCEVPIGEDEVQFISQGSFAPEVGQSLATGYQQAIDRVATKIVNMMEAPW